MGKKFLRMYDVEKGYDTVKLYVKHRALRLEDLRGLSGGRGKKVPLCSRLLFVRVQPS